MGYSNMADKLKDGAKKMVKVLRLGKVRDLLCDKFADLKIDYQEHNTYGCAEKGSRLIVIFENPSSTTKAVITINDEPYQVSKGIEAGTEVNLLVLSPDVTGTYTVTSTEKEPQFTITVPGNNERHEIPIVKNSVAKVATGNRGTF